MNELEFSDVVIALCKHPQVYTSHGTFDEVFCFLQGYALGANVGNSQHHSRFTPFFNWLKVKFSMPEDVHPWPIIEKNYPDERSAMEEFAKLYREYAEEISATKKKRIQLRES